MAKNDPLDKLRRNTQAGNKRDRCIVAELLMPLPKKARDTLNAALFDPHHRHTISAAAIADFMRNEYDMQVSNGSVQGHRANRCCCER